MSGLSAGACPQDGAEYKVQTRSMPTQIRFGGSSENMETKTNLKYLITTDNVSKTAIFTAISSCFLLFV